MMTSETIYADGVPVGRIVVETNTKEIAFLPAVSPSKLPDRNWESLEELRNAVIAAYQDKDQGVTLAGINQASQIRPNLADRKRLNQAEVEI